MTHSQVGESPLILAAGFGRVDCVNLLLSRGAKANHQDKVRVFGDVSLVTSENVELKCIFIHKQVRWNHY